MMIAKKNVYVQRELLACLKGVIFKGNLVESSPEYLHSESKVRTLKSVLLSKSMVLSYNKVAGITCLVGE